MASTQRVIKTRWGVSLNEVTLHEGNIPAAVTYYGDESALWRSQNIRPASDRREIF